MAKQVTSADALALLQLSPAELSRLSASDREDGIATAFALVAEAFSGDADKTALWFRTKNSMLGDISPKDMIRLGRFDRLRRFIVGALAERAPELPEPGLTQ